MHRQHIPPLIFLTLATFAACSESDAQPTSATQDEATAGADSEAQLFIATKLMAAFESSDAVVTGIVQRVETQRLPGKSAEPMSVVTLERVTSLSGVAPKNNMLTFWTWNDGESAAPQLTIGAEIAVGLIVRTGQKTTYQLSHPNALVALEGERVLVPQMNLERSAFAESLNRMHGGAR